MTRLLSELLDAREPTFRLNVRELERASGNPSADIRLSTEILQQVQSKLRELGLDPQNTTGEELYAALQTRLLGDEQRLRQHLGLEESTSSVEVLSAVEKFVQSLDVPRSCFALRTSVAKRLLQAVPPKKSMKHLGYRSLDSMLKHEPLPQLFTAAALYEPAHWHKALMEKYRQLRPSDFETRRISLFYPTSKRWEALAEEFAATRRHTSIAFKELGAIVVLPVQAKLPAMAITTTLLLLDSMNDIRCSSAFLKLQQVKPDFGSLAGEVASGEPHTAAHLAGWRLPWRLLQRYYSSVRALYHPALFEPHVQPEDLQLIKAEEALAQQIPALEFWVGTPHLALVDRGQTVSLNMLDVALSAANSLSFEDRTAQHVQASVWQELLTRYLNPYNLELVVRQLSDELEPQMELSEEANSDELTEIEAVEKEFA